MDEGTVVEWSVEKDGQITDGEIVVVVESEKASHEIEAREGGVLRRILTQAGGTVEPGTPIGIVAGPDEDLSQYESQLPDSIGTEAARTETKSVDTADAADAATNEQSAIDAGGGTASAASASSEEREYRASPGARRLASEEGVDLSRIQGTGPEGVIVEDDVVSHLESSETSSAGPNRTVVDSRELTGIQRTVSQRLSESYANAVHVTLNREYDVESLQQVVRTARESTLSVSVTDLLVAAVADTLTAFPEFNALFEDGRHQLIEEVNVGVAVDVDDGLVTPVIADADERSVEEIHDCRGSLVRRVESGEFTMDDLQGGTFTVSNLGPAGVDSFDPIINPPEITVLGVGRARDGTMTLSLSFDHRVVNGADAARFLDALVDRLIDADRLSSYFDANLSTESGPDTRDVRVETRDGFAGQYRAANGVVDFDEPEDVGGSGSAPSPVDHLLGALGSCLSLSLRQQARRDELALGTIETAVEGAPDHGPLESVAIHLELQTEAEETDIDRAVTKAERACYVARSLSDDLDISVEWSRA